MKHKHFSAKVDDDKISAAIAIAERQSTGQIRVLVSHHKCPDPMPEAQKHFQRLGMDKTPDQNGVFIFIAPESQSFALLGGTAIHERCGEQFWASLRDQMIPHFQTGHYTEGILHAIQRAAEELAKHFPARSGNNGDPKQGETNT